MPSSNESAAATREEETTQEELAPEAAVQDSDAAGEQSPRIRCCSSFGEDEALGQGLPAELSLKEYQRKVRGLLDTYLASQEIDEAILCFREFGQETSQCLDEVVVSSVHTALERTPQQRDLICTLLNHLHKHNVLDEPALVRGFAKLVCTWEDLVIDNGAQASIGLVGMIWSCIKARCIVKAFLTRLPEGLLLDVLKTGPEDSEAKPELQEVVDKLQKFKLEVDQANLFEPTGRSPAACRGKAEAMAQALRALAMPDYHHEFVKRFLVKSLDWSGGERSSCLTILGHLHSDNVLSREDLQWGTIRLLGQLEDLTLDCPGTADLAAEHLRGMMANGLLSERFVRRLCMLRVGGADGLTVLEASLEAAQAAAPEPAAQEQDAATQADGDAAAASPEDSGDEEAAEGEEKNEDAESKSTTSKPSKDDEDSDGEAADKAAEKSAAAEDVAVVAPSAPSESSSAPPGGGGGKLTGGTSLRPGGALLRPGGAGLRPGGALLGGSGGVSLTGGVSLRPGGALTGGLRPAGENSGGYPSQSKAGGDKGKEDKKKAKTASEIKAEESVSWRQDAAKHQEKKQSRRGGRHRDRDGEKERDKESREDRKAAKAERSEKGERGGVSNESLAASETSWAAQQRRRKLEAASGTSGPSDEEITRRMKSILNKFTLEKFDDLYKQLINCGISTEEHCRILMMEVFDKATMQHHFIEMYTLLCVNLSEWFAAHVKVGNFKRVLLDQCQASFEANLRPPSDLAETPKAATPEEEEELQEKRLKWKMRMMGNIRLVGNLLTKKMVASKVLIQCAEELLVNPSPSTLEPLASLLTATGKEFDVSSYKFHTQFSNVFSKVKKLTKDKNLPNRTRFLLQDVLDLRADGWEDRKKATKKLEGPKKLGEMAAET